MSDALAYGRIQQSSCLGVALGCRRCCLLCKRAHAFRPDLIQSARTTVLILNDEQAKSAQDQGREDEKGYEEEFHGVVPFSLYRPFLQLL